MQRVPQAARLRSSSLRPRCMGCASTPGWESSDPPDRRCSRTDYPAEDTSPHAVGSRFGPRLIPSSGDRTGTSLSLVATVPRQHSRNLTVVGSRGDAPWGCRLASLLCSVDDVRPPCPRSAIDSTNESLDEPFKHQTTLCAQCPSVLAMARSRLPERAEFVGWPPCDVCGGRLDTSRSAVDVDLAAIYEVGQQFADDEAPFVRPGSLA
jgi:hypothetical protein